MTESAENPPMSNECRPTAKPAVEFTALRAPFVRRTALAALVTAILVALFGAVYVGAGWALRYLFSAIWALVFFAVTPMIFKALLFDKRVLAGMLLLGFKFFWMAVMFIACGWMARDMQGAMLGSALIGGLTTPLAMIVLRAIGGGAAGLEFKSTDASL